MCEQFLKAKEDCKFNTDFVDSEALQVESLHITSCEAEPKSDMHKFALSALTCCVLCVGSLASPVLAKCKSAHAVAITTCISQRTIASQGVILYRAKNPIAPKEATVLSPKIKPKRLERARPFDRSSRSPILASERKDALIFSNGNKISIKLKRVLKDKPSANESHSSSFSPSYPLEVNELLEHNLANKLKAKNYVHKFFDRIDINASGKIGIDLDKVGLGKIAAVDIVGKLESGMTNELIQAQVNNHNANIGQIACDEVRKRDNHIMATEAHNLAQDIKTRSDLREEDNHDMSMVERNMSMEERKASLRRAEEAERRADELHKVTLETNKVILENTKKEGLKLDKELILLNREINK
nr:hypothetical protein [Interfilum sp. SAG 2147]WKT06278.1 hypothetical protein [Interfilum sp. SAG 2147]